MNLHLDNINPFCKCQQDGIRVTPENEDLVFSPRAKSARNIPSRPSSCHSPRTPSASHLSHARTGVQPPKPQNSSNGPKKVLLRYTDGGIKRPIAPNYAGAHGLPKLVRRYIGRRVGQYHELSVSKDPAIFIDTSKLSGALSIVSHGFYSR